MRDTIEMVVKALVDDPSAVDVREVQRDGTTRIEVRVAQPDMIPWRTGASPVRTGEGACAPLDMEAKSLLSR